MLKAKVNPFLATIAIALLAACAIPLKIAPMQPVELPDNFIQQGATQDLEAQLQLNDPKYVLNFPEGVELSKAFYAAQDGRLFIPAKSNGQLEYMAVDLSGGEILWKLSLPKKATLQRLNNSASGDLWLDVKFNGNTLVFLDPASGQEKWRYGHGAPEMRPMPFKYFKTANYNFFLGGNSIFVQDPATYEMISKAKRYTTDLQGINFLKGSTSQNYYNSKVIEDEDHYLVLDNGLHAFSKGTGQKLWSTRFPTVATQFYISENVARLFTGIHFLNKADGMSAGSLPNPSEDAAKFQQMHRLSPKSVLAVSKSRIICIDSKTLKPIWSLDMPWTLANLDHFYINSISEKHLYVRVSVDKTIKSCVVDKQTGTIIKRFEASQTLCTQNLLALQNDNRVSIYLQQPWH